MYGTVEELRRKGFERVHVELERYDGPRVGIADVDGRPHYFHSDALYRDDVFFVWPVDEATLALEREQWRIFADHWNARWVDGELLPTCPELGERYDELTAVLTPLREMPGNPLRLAAEWSWVDDLKERFTPEGVDYLVRWTRV